MPALLPSELPVRVTTRHHWVVLLRPPHKLISIAIVVLLVTAAVRPWPMAVVLGLVAAGLAFLRWQAWTAESVILTGKRIIRVQGVPESTSSEASLRVDRISGARLVETVPGKVLGYGTIELEAPGDHPGVRRLHKIADARHFYLELRRLVFGEGAGDDPDDEPPDGPEGTALAEYSTQPLPVIDDPGPSGRHRRW